MRRADFTYELPEELIAQQPLPRRVASRLLSLRGDTGELTDLQFADLPGLLRPGDLLVLNDTRVVPARLSARKPTGGAVEIMLERVLSTARCRVLARPGKGLRPGLVLDLAGGARATVLGREGDLFDLDFDAPVDEVFEAHGAMPLPPYIRRQAEGEDAERYQTVYARHAGAVAAPTAGLHFDEAMLGGLQQQGVALAFLTLHVGAGTFQPLRTDDVRDHRMHAERLQVGPELVAAVEACRARGGRVVAVGTTVVRGLETAARDGALVPFSGESALYIVPGFEFRVVDAMVTNFHLPESTLLLLVCAFAGREQVLTAYRHAVKSAYRFFSYGDAMFMTRREAP
ncbi:MAG: tRNA preQ1(34) S-adenosylmethionine ribosyltransferase-isomerase QueA [Steroidobacteraceae bacterium]